MKLLGDLSTSLKSYQGSAFLIAYSGGLDSTVLLHVMHALKSQLNISELHAIHIHHGLSPHADEWARHCERQCKALEIPLNVFSIQIKKEQGDSLEALARQHRLQAFANTLREQEILLTAHHQEDQAETILLQLCRGSGLKGLAAMPRKTTFNQGYWLRPFLDFTRADLKAYAVLHKLTWIEDESNTSLEFDRNYLRNQVMPQLKSRWPSVAKTFARSAQHCAEADAVMGDQIKKMLQSSMISSDPFHSNTLCLNQLKQYERAYQQLILREWWYQQGFQLPSQKKLDEVLEQMLHAAEDKSPCVAWSGCEVRRYRDQLYALAPLSSIANWESIWHAKESLVLPAGLGTLEPSFLASFDLPEDAKLMVRFRRGGETCRLPGQQHTQTLKNLFQQWGVPPWQRDRIPLVYYQDQIISIVGYSHCILPASLVI